jgi:phage FluMu protein Com
LETEEGWKTERKTPRYVTLSRMQVKTEMQTEIMKKNNWRLRKDGRLKGKLKK